MNALPAGRFAAGTAVVALLLAALLALGFRGRSAFADDPVKPAGADAQKAGTSTITVEELDERLGKHAPSLIAKIVLQYVLGTAGLVLLLLAWSRRKDIRAGLLPPPPPRTPPTAAFSPLASIGLFFVAFALTEIAGVILREMYGAHASEAAPTMARLLASGIPLLLVAVAIVVARRRARVAGSGSPPVPVGMAIKKGLWLVVVASAVGFVVTLAWGFLLIKTGQRPAPQELVVIVFDGPLSDAIAISVFGVLVAPFTEECLFRGLLYPAARAVMPPPVAGFLVAAGFAAIHMNLFAFVPLLAFAWMLAWLFEQTNSLVAVVVAHAAFNASSLLPLLLLRGQ